VKGRPAWWRAGPFNTTLHRTGLVALTTDVPPVVLNAAEAPIFADTTRRGVVGANLQTQLKTSFKAVRCSSRFTARHCRCRSTGRIRHRQPRPGGHPGLDDGLGQISSSTVTGPSLTRRPLHVGTEHAGFPLRAELSQAASSRTVTSGSATAPGAAAFHVAAPLSVFSLMGTG